MIQKPAILYILIPNQSNASNLGKFKNKNKIQNNKLTMLALRIIIVSLLIALSVAGYLTPEHIQQHIKRLISQRYQLYIINLGQTVNNHLLKAYVITGIRKQQTKISELTSYPATLITSYMHPRQPYSIKLIQKVLDDVLNNFQTDYFFKYMLDNSLLILFPFVNIDGYYRYQELTEGKNPSDVLEKYRKNMNKYGDCKKQWDFGVDINRNFDSSFGSLTTSDDQCSEQYRGPSPFSQKQSKAIKILYKKFHITLAVDIHSYGNQWIYPYASQRDNDKLQSSVLYPLYEDIFEEFRKLKRPMKSCFQSLGYTADGVYIDWALDQGTLSFAVEIGTNFDNDGNVGAQILFQAQQSFHKILRKNSISYSKRITGNNQLVIQSTSLINFQISVSLPNGKSLQAKMLQSRKSVVVKIAEGVQKVIFKVKNTIIEEQIIISTLKKVEETPVFVGVKKNISSLGVSKLKAMIVAVIVIALVLLGLLIYVLKMKEQQKKQSYSLPKTSDGANDDE